MTHGILSTALAALAWGGLTEGCRPAADPAQVQEVDGMIASVDAALLTLNELDLERYRRADSLFTTTGEDLRRRFTDTLDRNAAQLLGDHYLVLRAAQAMGADQRRVQDELGTTAQRLRALRTDLVNGALPPDEAGTALGHERILHQELDSNVHRVIANYRSVQGVWEQRNTVDSLLAVAQPTRTTRP